MGTEYFLGWPGFWQGVKNAVSAVKGGADFLIVKIDCHVYAAERNTFVRGCCTGQTLGSLLKRRSRDAPMQGKGVVL